MFTHTSAYSAVSQNFGLLRWIDFNRQSGNVSILMSEYILLSKILTCPKATLLETLFSASFTTITEKVCDQGSDQA